MRGYLGGMLAALAGLGAAQAQSPPATVNPALDAYAQPQRLARLADGRRIHLHCRGTGSPTVILTAGLGGWATSWVKVQSEIARRTRTCAWDRAGYGHSDPSPLPQTVANTTADLEGALAAARIRGPYVLVGHSAGAFETLMFADRRRTDVAGMVLVDASVPGQPTRFATAAPELAKSNAVTQAQAAARQQACADQVAAGTLKPDQAAWSGCFRYPPTHSPVMTAVLTRLDADPARLRTRLSLSAQFGPNADAVANPVRSYGDLPLVVLTQAGSLSPPGADPDQAAALTAGWLAWHDDYARLSTRGVNLIVRGAGHNIQADKPEAVIGAVDAVLAQAGRRRP